jgi:hypothetical protein
MTDTDYLEETMEQTWSGSPCPLDPDNFWMDDDTGERVDARTGERRPYTEDELRMIAEMAAEAA